VKSEGGRREEEGRRKKDDLQPVTTSAEVACSQLSIISISKFLL
jgi:hypothetical protein